MKATILNSANLNSTILNSAILVFPLKLIHTCQDWFPPFAQINFPHSFWLNLMMAAILNSAMLDSDTAILDSDTLLSSLRFTQKHSHSTLTLNQTNSIWLKLIPSHVIWWWQPSWILPSWIQLFCTKLLLKLIQSDSNSFILTQLDEGSHLEFGHLGFSHFAQKKTSLIHSDLNWWWQPSWILPHWFQTLPSWIQTPCYHLSDSLKKHSHSTLTLNQTNSIWLKLIPSHVIW